ncbi:hypothetical protein Tco_0812893, partial [Tanacetum coccineum]
GAAILIAFFMSAVFHEVAGKALFMAYVEGQLKAVGPFGSPLWIKSLRNAACITVAHVNVSAVQEL